MVNVSHKNPTKAARDSNCLQFSTAASLIDSSGPVRRRRYAHPSWSLFENDSKAPIHELVILVFFKAMTETKGNSLLRFF